MNKGEKVEADSYFSIIFQRLKENCKVNVTDVNISFFRGDETNISSIIHLSADSISVLPSDGEIVQGKENEGQDLRKRKIVIRSLSCLIEEVQYSVSKEDRLFKANSSSNLSSPYVQVESGQKKKKRVSKQNFFSSCFSKKRKECSCSD